MVVSSSYLAPAILKFPKPAFRAIRLIDFATGTANLRKEHEAWLVQTARAIPDSRKFGIYIFGYASKLGFRGQNEQQSDASNVALSYKRANAAAQIMELVNPRVTTRIDQFRAEGSRDYSAPASDDDAFWRAVEIHVFLDDPPPPPPQPVPPDPCPGGRRFRKWSVAIPVGFSGNPIPLVPGTLAGNLVLFRLDEDAGPIIHYYALPAAGVGGSWLIPGWGDINKWLKRILSGISVSDIEWSSFTADTPFNFRDLDGATCQIMSVAGPGANKCRVSVYGPLWFREPSGKCMFASKDFFTNVDASGADLQYTISGSAIGGPLLRII
jgi:hypothetical protein